jgi:hypothetical protein
MNDKRNERRKKNYQALRSARFSSYFCTRFKDRNREDVKSLAYLKKSSDETLVAQIVALTGVYVDVEKL